jgi:inosose dehydratase
MSDQSRRIRFGTDIITFFETGYWGLSPKPSYEEWVAIVEAAPRHYFDGMLDGCVAAGVEGVELAPPPGGWRTALAAYGSTDGVRDALTSRGLSLASSFAFAGPLVGAHLDDPSGVASADDEMREHARFVAALGGQYVVLSSMPRAEFTGGDASARVEDKVYDSVAEHLNRLGAVAAGEGVGLALHTDAYSLWSREADVARILDRTDADTVGLCLDAGHVTLDGTDAVAVLRSWVDRVRLMHWKDCVGPLDGSTLVGPVMERHEVMLTYFRVLGSGVVDWPEWQRILRDAGWQGWAIAEIDMSPRPVEEIQQGLAFFEQHLAPIYS